MRVFALSCEHDLSPGSEQHRWLEEMLKKANEPEERKRVPWIVGSNHMPGYTSGMHRERCRQPPTPIANRHSVLYDFESL